MVVSNELIYFCRDLVTKDQWKELVFQMSDDSVTRFTSANPKDMAELQAARSQYDAVQDMASLVHKYAKLDVT